MRTSGSARSWVPAAAAVSTAGWGVNQFAPLSVVYRTQAHWPAVSVAAMFSTYVLGFVPGVLLGGPMSERRGRRIVRPALALSAIASLSGCAAFRDGHPTTQSQYQSAEEKAYWADRRWRQDIARKMREEDRRLSRLRLAEFFD